MLQFRCLSVLACLPLLLVSALPRSGECSPNVKGRWTNKLDAAARWVNDHDEAAPAVHMMLLPGGLHSQILWYNEHAHTDTASHFDGGVMGWHPDSTASDGDCSSYPSSRFRRLETDEPPSNIFCSAHSALKSGKGLITAGTEGGEIGTTSSVLFDPATRTWTVQGEMANRRWYPTTTALPDGRVLVSSGSRFAQLHGFGGRNGSGTLAPDSLELFGMTLAGEWSRYKHPTSFWPAARDGHASCLNRAIDEWTLFGGRNQGGSYLKDVWFMYHNKDLDDREDLTAIQVTPSVDGPSPRAWAAMVGPSVEHVLFGGIDEDSVRSDTWQLWREVVSPTEIYYHWLNLTDSVGTPPAARHGHTAVWDSPNQRMLVFGGSAANGSPIDSALHVLPIDSTAIGPWSVATVDADPEDGRPAMRDGHVFVRDPYERNTAQHGAPSGYSRRFILFGGRSGSTLLNDLWVLWVPAPGGGNYRWQKVHVDTSTSPAGRFRLAGEVDFNDRFILSGGDLGGTISDQTWTISSYSLTKTTNLPWSQLEENPYGARSGHSMHPRKLLWARQQEYYNPASGNWTTAYQTGQIPSRKTQDWYPFHFVMPNSDSLRVFAAGPDVNSYVLNLSANPPTWRFVASSSAEPDYPFRGGSAVMYKPGSFMKCGSRDTDEQGSTALRTTKTLEIPTTSFASAPTTWTTRDSMGTGRVNHNLVILPTGHVFATGGTGVVGNAANANPVYTPQIWDPATKTWTPFTGSNALAADSTIRGYHSNAILLPDGRVLTAAGASYTSGDSADVDSRRITIFCPPYLFDGSGNLKSRPAITSAPESLDYAAVFELGVSSGTTVKSICLIKPSSSTHAFNMDQRYLPLNYELCEDVLRVDTPMTARWAPPGYYLLFVVRDDDMPSIGRWVWVGDIPSPDELPFCEGEFAMMSGGGGGGEGDPLAGEESMAIASPTGLDLGPVEGEYRLTLNQGGLSHSSFDGVRLTAVDHAPGAEVFAVGDRIVTGERVPALGISGAERDIAVDAFDSGDPARILEAGEAIEAELATDAQGRAVVLFEARISPRAGVSADGPALRVRTQSTGGSWVDVKPLTPRPRFATFALDSCYAQVRIECSQAVEIRGLGSLEVTTTAARPAPLSLVAARLEGEEVEETPLSATSDEAAVALAPGEQLNLSWSAPALGEGLARSLFLDVEGSTAETGRSTAYDAARFSGGAPATFRFALEASRPNPTSGRTMIPFSLATQSRVTIELFDVAGRRVRTLVDETRVAGPHEVTWDGRNDAGRSVGTGVFFYRMQAGEWQSRKKLIVLRTD